MKPKVDAKTRKQLIALNQRFYAEAAEAFDATRREPWHGWSRAIRHLSAEQRTSLSVLDVGCGNGRFASFLEAELGPGFHYRGVDTSPALLDHARQKHAHLPRADFVRGDILASNRDRLQHEAPYALVAVFGLLHHVPGDETRKALIEQLIDLLSIDGLLVVTAWQFGAGERFRDHLVPWAQYNEGTTDPIDSGQLDVGDHLLRFGDQPLPRYCHFLPPEELETLFENKAVQWLDRYASDGRSGDLNHYAIVRRVA